MKGDRANKFFGKRLPDQGVYTVAEESHKRDRRLFLNNKGNRHATVGHMRWFCGRETSVAFSKGREINKPCFLLGAF
jgi:hypothetical protein